MQRTNCFLEKQQQQKRVAMYVKTDVPGVFRKTPFQLGQEAQQPQGTNWNTGTDWCC